MGIRGLNVTLAELGPSSDVLIGMDVITMRDFAITNRDGKTKMTFRVPSTVSYDYVQEINSVNGTAPSRADRRGQRPNPKKSANSRQPRSPPQWPRLAVGCCR